MNMIKEPSDNPMKKIIISAIAVAFALILFVVYALITDYNAKNHYVSFDEYYEYISENVAYTTIGGTILNFSDDALPVVIDGEVHIPSDLVKKYIDEFIFWDGERLVITTSDEVMRLTEGFIAVDGEAFIHADFVMERYDVEIAYNEQFGIITVDLKTEARKVAEISAKTARLRYSPDIKSSIFEKLEKGTHLFIYENDKNESEFVLVRSMETGVVGYVNKEELGNFEEIAANPRPVAEIAFAKPIEGKINLIWDMISFVDANKNEDKRIVREGLDVLSPTWFSFDLSSLNGDIISVADKSYVDWAHEQGYQVWALITDNFDSDVCRHIMSDTTKREHTINQLVAFVDELGLDGINIDFEMVHADHGSFYIQFLRELAPPLHNRGLYLSVDMYVPSASSMHYNRRAAGITADYIMIMAYDEHWGSCPTAGPVASIGFVEKGVLDTLEEVSKEKVILGLPYYVRIWTETPMGDGTVTVKSNDFAMSSEGKSFGLDVFHENNAQFLWDEGAACYYAECNVEENGVTVRKRVWNEEERSISEKLKIAVKYDLAGVAGWRRNLENDNIWPLILKEFKNLQ